MAIVLSVDLHYLPYVLHTEPPVAHTRPDQTSGIGQSEVFLEAQERAKECLKVLQSILTGILEI